MVADTRACDAKVLVPQVLTSITTYDSTQNETQLAAQLFSPSSFMSIVPIGSFEGPKTVNLEPMVISWSLLLHSAIASPAVTCLEALPRLQLISWDLSQVDAGCITALPCSWSCFSEVP